MRPAGAGRSRGGTNGTKWVVFPCRGGRGHQFGLSSGVDTLERIALQIDSPLPRLSVIQLTDDGLLHHLFCDATHRSFRQQMRKCNSGTIIVTGPQATVESIMRIYRTTLALIALPIAISFATPASAGIFDDIGKTVKSVGKAVTKTAKDVSRGVSKTVKSVDRAAGSAVRDIGRGVTNTVRSVDRAAGSAARDVGRGVTNTVRSVDRAAGSAVRDINRGLTHTVRAVDRAADSVVRYAPHRVIAPDTMLLRAHARARDAFRRDLYAIRRSLHGSTIR
jgi:hypothetical protein